MGIGDFSKRVDDAGTFLMVAALPDSLVTFRYHLLNAIRSKGYRVVACAAHQDPLSGIAGADVAARLGEIGVTYRSFPLARTGGNPFMDLCSLLALWRLCRKERPDVVLCYTAKPVIYGSLGAKLAGVPAIFSMMTGLPFGLAEGDGGRPGRKQLARTLFRLALSVNKGVIFQNPDDERCLRTGGLLPERIGSVVVNGSGVDLEHFKKAPLPSGPCVFLLIARLIREKGIVQYAEAAGRLKQRYPHARFILVGPLDGHEDGLRESEVRAWEQKGLIEWAGVQSDVREALAMCSVFVLPTYYHEGTPRVVLEAMAMGRPVVTTDLPGCRETVRLTEKGRGQQAVGEPVMEGENGFLIKPRNVDAVEVAMEHFLLHPERLPVLAERSRRLAEKRYNVHDVNTMMLRMMGLSS